MSKHERSERRGRQRLDRAIRLVFERRGADLKLTTVQRLRMIVPPPQALYPAQGEQGSWFELRDRDHRPIYRRVIEDPLQDLEVVADNPDRPLQRYALDDPRGAFFLIVPDIADARRVVLRSQSQADTAPRATGKGARKATRPPLVEFDFSRIDRKER